MWHRSKKWFARTVRDRSWRSCPVPPRINASMLRNNIVLSTLVAAATGCEADPGASTLFAYSFVVLVFKIAVWLALPCGLNLRRCPSNSFFLDLSFPKPSTVSHNPCVIRSLLRPSFLTLCFVTKHIHTHIHPHPLSRSNICSKPLVDGSFCRLLFFVHHIVRREPWRKTPRAWHSLFVDSLFRMARIQTRNWGMYPPPSPRIFFPH